MVFYKKNNKHSSNTVYINCPIYQFVSTMEWHGIVYGAVYIQKQNTTIYKWKLLTLLKSTQYVIFFQSRQILFNLPFQLFSISFIVSGLNANENNSKFKLKNNLTLLRENYVYLYNLMLLRENYVLCNY